LLDLAGDAFILSVFSSSEQHHDQQSRRRRQQLSRLCSRAIVQFLLFGVTIIATPAVIADFGAIRWVRCFSCWRASCLRRPLQAMLKSQDGEHLAAPVSAQPDPSHHAGGNIDRDLAGRAADLPSPVAITKLLILGDPRRNYRVV
jgi:hypothetical protein